MENKPLVSVIISVYNCERYLAEAIESVLNQTYSPIELIVIDDGSTDGSGAVAKSFASLKYHFQPNRGLGAARNKGIDLSDGSFIAFLDADDVWISDKLSSQLAIFDADPKLDIVFGYVKQFHSPDLDGNIKAKINITNKVMPGHIAGTLLIKRESFFRVGYFPTNWRVGEFIDWYIKATEIGLKSFIFPEVVMERRIHENNMGIREHDSRGDYVRILKASLDRKRKGL